MSAPEWQERLLRQPGVRPTTIMRSFLPIFGLIIVYIAATFHSQIACPANLVPPPQIVETTALLATSKSNKDPATVDEVREKKPRLIEAVSCPQAKDGVCRLEFVHIPKTAGTAIEVAAVMANQTWSVCHWREQFRLGPRGKTYKCPPRGRRRSEGPPFKFDSKISLWHLPPIYLSQEKNFPRNPYADNAALFTVVRNPYDRAISEYYSQHAGMDPEKFNLDKFLNDPAKMNRYISDRLQWYLINKNVGDLILYPRKGKENLTVPEPIYFQSDGHFIPQYDYVFYGGQRVIHHVLHFESLQDEFAALMRAYNRTDLVLPQKGGSNKQSTNEKTSAPAEDQPTGRVSHVRTLGIENLTDATIQLIDHIYARDFMAFGYQARSHLMDI